MSNQFSSLRYGVPLFFNDDDARSDYERLCQRLRTSMPAGECRVAPRVNMSTHKGRPLEGNMLVTAADFGDGATGRARLDALVDSGHILRSEAQSDAERAAITEHCETVKRMSDARTAESVAGQLAKLLESGRFARVEPNDSGPQAA